MVRGCIYWLKAAAGSRSCREPHAALHRCPWGWTTDMDYNIFTATRYQLQYKKNCNHFLEQGVVLQAWIHRWKGPTCSLQCHRHYNSKSHWGFVLWNTYTQRSKCKIANYPRIISLILGSATCFWRLCLGPTSESWSMLDPPLESPARDTRCTYLWWLLEADLPADCSKLVRSGCWISFYCLVLYFVAFLIKPPWTLER